MTKKHLPILLATFVVCTSARSEAPANSDKPLTQDELLKQIEAFSPQKMPPSKSTASAASAGDSLLSAQAVGNDVLKPSAVATAPGALAATPTPAGGTMIGSGTVDPNSAKKSKGPTEITALEATFDQKSNIAVFVGGVIVKDPEFNVVCDKLTAWLKHDEKGKTPAGVAKAATPKPATPGPNGATPAPKKGGGLDHAIAVTMSDRRVIITQDKVEADGSITHGIGKSDWAFYDANTGDIVLHGNPDVVQGQDRCVATDYNTVITLNRDGNMHAVGPHKTFIVDDSSRDSGKSGAASPTPAARPDARNPQ